MYVLVDREPSIKHVRMYIRPLFFVASCSATLLRKSWSVQFEHSGDFTMQSSLNVVTVLRMGKFAMSIYI